MRTSNHLPGFPPRCPPAWLREVEVATLAGQWLRVVR